MLSVLGAGAGTFAVAGQSGLKGPEAGTARIKCKAAAMSGKPELPAGFPKPREVMYTSDRKAGPTLIVNGYFAAALDEALSEYGAAVKRAGYTNLKTEHEAHDAEINFAGGGITGQIALRDTCKERDTTLVLITARPKSAASKVPAAIAKLEPAAEDLVRETSFRDKAGSRRAFTALKSAFKKAEKLLETKARDEAEEIDPRLDKVDKALKSGDFREANDLAKEIRSAVEDAVRKFRGGGSTAKGLDLVMEKLKEAARELDREASFKDTAGTKRALSEFQKLFNANKRRIEAKSAAAEELIGKALAKVSEEVRAGDTDNVRPATRALLAAVAKAAKLV
jgi:hypothetical protein